MVDDINIEKLSILLIDIQNVFVDHLRMGAKERIIPKQIEILKKCEENHIPIYVIELDAPDFPKEIMELNSQVDEALKNIQGKVLVIKKSDNAFTGTRLEEMLTEQNITHLLLMGVNAQGCVLDTAKTAIDKGFKIITSSDLIAGQPTDREDDCAPWFKENGVYFQRGLMLFSSC